MGSSQRQSAAIAMVASAIAGLIGCFGVLAHALGIPALGTFGVGTTYIRLTAATTLLVAGGSTLIAARFGSRAARLIAGAMLAFVGTVTMLGWSAAFANGGWPWFLSVASARGALEPPSLPAGALFALLGCALLVLERGRSPFRRPADWLALLGALAAFTVITAFAHGAATFAPRLGQQDIGMALPTAVALFALSVAVLFLPVRGVAASVLLSNAPGARLAGRVIATALVVPPLLGLLVRLGSTAGLRDVHAQFAALMSVTSSVAIAGAVFSAIRLAEVDEARVRGELASRRLAALVESSNDAIIGMDPTGVIVAWNPGAERLYGWSQAEAIGRDLAMTIPDDRQSERVAIMKAVAAGELIPPYETVRLRKDGSSFDASITVSAVWDAEHRLIGYSGIVRDVSEQKRLEVALRAGEARFRALFEHSLDGIFVADLEGRYVEVNDAGCRMLRTTRDRIVGRTILDFIHAEEVPRLAADREAIIAGGNVVSEWLMRRGDGTWATIEVGTCMLPDGRWLGLTRDVSARREAEDELRRLHESERVLRQLREEWTAVVAHDLRQPVSSIALSAQTLCRRRCKELPEADRQLIARVQSGAERLGHMIDDLLDYAQIEAGRLRITPRHVELASLVAETIERLAPLLPGQAIRVRLDGGAYSADADPDRLDQVITNLVTNAAKYGEPDGEIEVRLGARDHEVEIAVTNRGAGLTEGEQQRLFERFYRTPAAAGANTPGLGLGLFIVKGIVEAHGGRIEVESTPGQTTTFRIVLPGERHSLAA